MRTHDNMVDLISGNHCVIESIDNGLVTLDDGRVLAADVVKNCFYFAGNETPYPAPAVTVNGNDVIVDGKRVETGIMSPERVVATMPGAALILIKGKDDKHDLVRYDAAEERFNYRPIAEGIDRVDTLYDEDGILVYAVVSSDIRKVKDEDDNVVEMDEYRDTVFVLKDGKSIGQHGNMLLSSFEAKVLADDGRTQLFFLRRKGLKPVEDVDGYEFNIVEKLDGVDLVEISLIDDVDEDGEVVDTYTSRDCGHYPSFDRVGQIHDGHHGAFVVTGNGVAIFGRRHMAIGDDVLDVAKHYPYLVKFVPYSADHDHDTFVFADRDYNAKSVRVKRVGGPVGYVTTIE